MCEDYTLRTAEKRLSFRSYGVPFTLCFDDDRLIDAFVDRIPPGSYRVVDIEAPLRYEIRSAEATSLALYLNQLKIACTADVTEMLDQFEGSVQLHVAGFCDHLLFVHAGVVCWRQHAIVIPGRSFSGKTTLVRELVAAGAQYLSDEYACIDSTGVVHAFGRPMSVRTNNGKCRLQVPIVDSHPRRTALFVLTRHEPGCCWAPQVVSSGTLMLALIENCVSVRKNPAGALATLRAALTGAVAVRSVRGEAADAAASILECANAVLRHAKPLDSDEPSSPKLALLD